MIGGMLGKDGWLRYERRRSIEEKWGLFLKFFLLFRYYLEVIFSLILYLYI